MNTLLRRPKFLLWDKGVKALLKLATSAVAYDGEDEEVLGFTSKCGSGPCGRGLITGIVVLTVYGHGFQHYKYRLDHSVW